LGVDSIKRETLVGVSIKLFREGDAPADDESSGEAIHIALEGSIPALGPVLIESGVGFEHYRNRLFTFPWKAKLTGLAFVEWKRRLQGFKNPLLTENP
jgi:hypothetical protein